MSKYDDTTSPLLSNEAQEGNNAMYASPFIGIPSANAVPTYEASSVNSNSNGNTTVSGLAALDQQVKTFGNRVLGYAKSKVHLGPIRREREFFGLGEVKPFNAPAADEVVSRLRHNVLYFSSNYLIIYFMLVAISIITSPISLLSLSALCAGWFVVSKAQSNQDVDYIPIGSFKVQKGIAYIIMLGVTILCGLLLLESFFSWPLWVGGVFTLGHTATRDPSGLIAAPQMAGEVPSDQELNMFIAQSQI